jgi:beta-lactamase class A
MNPTRRSLIAAGSTALLAGCVGFRSRSATRRLEEIRAQIGGRLGVHALDTGSGRSIGLAGNARFSMASTFKLMLGACVLADVDDGTLQLGQNIAVSATDLVTYSPVTTRFATSGHMTVEELCSAIVVESDNGAANVLLRLMGGPSQLTKFMLTIGDRYTRLDRYELDLNSNLPGDPRDTTTPRTMVASMQRVLLGNALSESSRARLLGWLIDSQRGLQRIRAGLPHDWRVGDKTGTGQNGAVNDLAILWPPGRQPILVAIYMSGSPLRVDALSAAHASIARLIVEEFG